MDAVAIARAVLVGDGDMPGYDPVAVDAALSAIDAAAIESQERARIEIRDGWVYYAGRRTHTDDGASIDELTARATARRIAEAVAARLTK